MELEKQVVSLPQSKRLKELGVNQIGAHYYWYDAIINSDSSFHLVNYCNWHNGHLYANESVVRALSGDSRNEVYSAFTVAELMQALPSYYASWFGNNDLGKTGWVCCHVADIPTSVLTAHYTQASCLADTLIHLIESNLISVDEVNKRLL